MLCAESWSHGLYNTMTDLFPYLTNILAKEEEDQDAKLLELFQQPRPDRNETEKMAKMAIKLHDETLVCVYQVLYLDPFIPWSAYFRNVGGREAAATGVTTPRWTQS